MNETKECRCGKPLTDEEKAHDNLCSDCRYEEDFLANQDNREQWRKDEENERKE